MIKPTKYTRTAYDFFEIRDYVNDKYNIDIDDYKRRADDKFRCFWHFIHGNIHNGSYFYLPGIWTLDDDHDEIRPWWVREILELIYKEFPECETEAVFVQW